MHLMNIKFLFQKPFLQKSHFFDFFIFNFFYLKFALIYLKFYISLTLNLVIYKSSFLKKKILSRFQYISFKFFISSLF